MSNLFDELKRRNVFKVATAYAVVSWLILQVLNSIIPIIEAPEWASKVVLIMLVSGFPIALLLTWAFELTPEGIKKSAEVKPERSIAHHTSRKIDFIIIATLVLIVGGMGYERLTLDPRQTQIIEQPSIAVLAFEDFSPNRDQAYFAEGISDEILNLLAKTHTMKVAGRTSSFSFKGKDDDIPTIASKLNVDHVLEGSINKSDNKLKITAQLINSEGHHVWSETYKRELTDIFDIQEEIASAIMSELKIKLLGDNNQQPKVRKVDVELYNQYLLAKKLYEEHERSSMTRARALLTEVTQADPTFGEAQALLSLVLSMSNYWEYGDFSPYEASRIAEAPMKLALAFAPDSAEVQAINCERLIDINGKINEAKIACEKAIAINPSHTDAQRWLSTALRLQWHFDEALKVLLDLQKKDPISLMVNVNLASAYIRRNNFEEAEKFLNQIKIIDPDNVNLIALKVRMMIYEEKPAEALFYGMKHIDKLKAGSGETELMGEIAGMMRLDDLAEKLLIPPVFAYFDLEYGNIEKAINRVNEVLKTDPESAMGKNVEAQVELIRGNPAIALEKYLELVKRDGYYYKSTKCYIYAYYHSVTIAVLYKQLGQDEQATFWIKPCRELLKAQEAHAINPGESASLKADLHYFDGEYEKGLAVMQKNFKKMQHYPRLSLYVTKYVKELESYQHLVDSQNKFWAEQKEIYLKLQEKNTIK